MTDMDPTLKGKMSSRVKSYKNELARLQRDFVRIEIQKTISYEHPFYSIVHRSLSIFGILIA